MARALVLYSGSLASKVTLRLAQGVPGLELKILYFRSPFFLEPEEVEDRFYPPGGGLGTKTLKREYLGMAASGDDLPFPCGACRWVLLSRAARLLRRGRFDYVITGEIVGRGGLQAPQLAALDRELGLVGRVLRPLSGRLLPSTLAEERGDWPPRLMFDLTSPHRKRLELLARSLGVSPGVEAEERCHLANPVYVARLRLLLARESPTVNTLRLLTFRHFFHLPPDLKVVVALDQREQALLQTLFLPTDMRLYFSLPRSPLVLVRADWSTHPRRRRLEAATSAARIALALAGFSPGALCELCFRFEWEEETRRLAVVAPASLEEALMPASTEVYLTS